METDGLRKLLVKSDEELNLYNFDPYEYTSGEIRHLAESLTLTNRLIGNLLTELNKTNEEYLVCRNCFTYHNSREITALRKVEFLSHLYSAQAECTNCKELMGDIEIDKGDWVLCNECNTYHLEDLVKDNLVEDARPLGTIQLIYECDCGNLIEVGDIYYG